MDRRYILSAGEVMSFFVMLLLGIVQGVCEFLPISSSGHLVLLSSLFGVEESIFVSVVLHLATLLAVIIVFRAKLVYVVKHPFCLLSKCLFVATISTCFVGFFCLPLLKNSFSGKILPFSFIFTGALLLLLPYLPKKKNSGLTIRKAVFVGLTQAVALFPGISRSGTTICGGQMCGLSQKESAEFSFLLSIPTILASLCLELVDLSFGAVLNINWFALLIGFLLAFVVGIVSIKFMLRLIEKSKLKWFSLYLFVLALVCMVIFW